MSGTGSRKSDAEGPNFKCASFGAEEGTRVPESPFVDSDDETTLSTPPPSPPRRRSHRGGTVTALDAAKVAEAISPKAHQEKNQDRSIHHIPNYVDLVKELRNPLSSRSTEGPKVDSTDLPEHLKPRLDQNKTS